MDKKKILNIAAVFLLAVSVIIAVVYAKNNNYSAYYISYGSSDSSCPNIYIEDDGDRFYFGRNNKRVYISNFFNYFTDENGVYHEYQSNVYSSYSSGGLTGTHEALIIFAACVVVIGIAWAILRFNIQSAESKKKELEKIQKLSGGAK